MGNPVPVLEKGSCAPNFRPISIEAKRLVRQVGLSLGDFVLDRDPAAQTKKGADPPIFGHVYYDQMAGWIKMPLGTDVGLGPGHIVLDGDPAPPKRGTASLPLFCTCLSHCVRWGSSSPSHRKGHSSPPLFGPCLLWPNGRPSQLLMSSC